jgi:hypothetical protein
LFLPRDAARLRSGGIFVLGRKISIAKGLLFLLEIAQLHHGVRRQTGFACLITQKKTNAEEQ